ncbi:hypothetical protein DCAR_0310582 [Daucus carota subsp. sativus]|uniref:Uncharacterized protein n=2 Tax=Daucus carota subsp. sativus TaxID=79200 RepID=A0A166A0A9_DAUCS|nr:hypothetical protein DCAR_0310582 [Daucus carota subsp. sativus]
MDRNLCHEKVAVEYATPLNLSSAIFSAKQLTDHEDEEPLAECVFKPNPESETDRIYQKSSDAKHRRVVNAAVRPSISQSYGLEMNCKYDEVSEQKFNIEYAAIESGQLEETVGGNENSVEQTNRGKRRCSKWDQGPKEDKKEVIEERKCKKGKTVWDANDFQTTVQEPLQLTELRSRVCEPLLDLEVQSLKKRFSEISSILDPLVDDKLEIGVYAFDKLIKEREKIFLELAKRNAIISKELYVPVKEYPKYNFIGLILGPKGNTQKRMELKSGCMIRLRGKDSSKSAQEVDSSEDEELNVYIEAVSQKSLDAAVCMVNKLLISVEDEVNDLKRAHLEEVSNLKEATLFSSCSVCKEPGHDQLACPLKKATLKASSDTCVSFSRPSFSCPVTHSNLKIKSSREIDAANLYVGYLPQTIDDSRLHDLFSPFGTITQLRVTLDKKTGYSMGYGFVRFDTPSAANLAIMHMNGYQIGGHRLRVRIAGAPPATGQPATSFLPVCSNPGPATVATSYSALPHYMMPKSEVSVLNDEGMGVSSSLHMESSNKISQTEAPTLPQKASGSNLFVGYLPPTVDDSGLWELFSSFGTIIHLKVPLDMVTGYSKGYGFVRYDTPSAASLAIMHMNGYEVDGRRLTVRIAGDPPATGQPTMSLLPVNPVPGPATVATSCPALPEGMVLNSEGLCYPSSQHIKYSTNLYVGYLPQTIDDSCLRELFSPFGAVTQSSVVLDMRTGYSKGYGFVSFDTPSAASLAMMHMNGYQIDGHRLAVRLRTVGAAPPTGPPATSRLPLYSIPQHTTVATSCPALPSYMMPNFSQNMESKNENDAPIISQEVSGSTGSNTQLSTTASVLRSSESGTASSSAGSLTALSSTGLAAASSKSRSVISSYSFSSLFCGDHDYRDSSL